MYAAIWGQQDMARILLQNGADPWPKDARGDTALSHAVGESQPEIADMIREALEKDARPGSKFEVLQNSAQQKARCSQLDLGNAAPKTPDGQEVQAYVLR